MTVKEKLAALAEVQKTLSKAVEDTRASCKHSAFDRKIVRWEMPGSYYDRSTYGYDIVCGQCGKVLETKETGRGGYG